ncbi:hypothetical protein F5Y00DRAFT_225485 [Daldinia vernicosa]|uniref:uncharacterized protein n=1 Tax=Daldinia vernicosa TaxID=114800 RepID=UPI0020077F39|nr:uncharacterized protein F5Y00DRAFT_225485 [Daldinia vernicosa]KAI0853117.1 hypothetical protein F5Y00DRAFT_225485 [Daldinia vernicosa]
MPYIFSEPLPNLNWSPKTYHTTQSWINITTPLPNMKNSMLITFAFLFIITSASWAITAPENTGSRAYIPHICIPHHIISYANESGTGRKRSSSLPSNLESDLKPNLEFGFPDAAAQIVMLVLEFARNSPSPFTDPIIITVLGEALRRIWLKLFAIPSYVMTRNEFAVFNFFQNQYLDGGIIAEIAARARAAYWDGTYGDD